MGGGLPGTHRLGGSLLAGRGPLAWAGQAPPAPLRHLPRSFRRLDPQPRGVSSRRGWALLKLDADRVEAAFIDVLDRMRALGF